MDKHIMSLPRSEYDELVSNLHHSRIRYKELETKYRLKDLKEAPNKIAIVLIGDKYHCAMESKVEFVEGTTEFEEFIEVNFLSKETQITRLKAEYSALEAKHNTLKTAIRGALK
jgi:hypothetical protein